MGLVTVQILSSDGTPFDVIMDNVSDQLYPIYKLGVGDLGNAGVPVSSSNPMPVDIKSAINQDVSIVSSITQDIDIIGINGSVDTGNSSNTPLSANAKFTGTMVDVLNVAHVVIFAYSDVASATDGLLIEWSADGTNFDESDVFDIPAGNAKTFSFGPPARFMRVSYTNGGSNQTEFRLQTITRTTQMKGSSHRINDLIIGQDDAELVKALITGEKPNGDFVNFKSTANGNFKTSLEEVNGNVAVDADTGAGEEDRLGVVILSAEDGGGVLVGTANPFPVSFVDPDGVTYAVKHVNNKIRTSSMPYTYDIAESNVPNHKALRKFGHNSGVGSTLEDIWDGSAAYVYLTSAEILQVSSDDVDDQGNVLSSGTATGGSTTTLIDTGATFVSDGVTAGDIVLDDTKVLHGIIKTVDSEIQITFELELSSAVVNGDAYRVVEANDTGAAVVEISGLDANYDQQREYVVLATATTTATVKSYIRIFRSIVRLAGSSGWNEGDIAIRNNADDNLLAQITATLNQTLMAIWTVPRNFIGFLTSFYASTSSSKATEVHLYVRPFGEVFQVKKVITIFAGEGRIPYDFPLKIPEKADVVVRASAALGGGDVSAGFDLWYEQ